MKKLILALLLLILTALLFGCTTNPEDIAKRSPEIKNYLQAHPDAKMTITSFSPASFSEQADFWVKNCKQEIPLKDYYVVEQSDTISSLKVLFDKSDMSFVCSVEEKFVPNLGNISSPGGNLPSGSCIAQRGESCTSTQYCSGDYVNATDANKCCKGVCLNDPTPKPPAPIPCESATGIVTCAENQKCTQGFTDLGKYCGCTKCEAKVCADYGGMICSAEKSCSSEFITASDGNRCCLGVCYSLTTTVTSEFDITNEWNLFVNVREAMRTKNYASLDSMFTVPLYSNCLVLSPKLTCDQSWDYYYPKVKDFNREMLTRVIKNANQTLLLGQKNGLIMFINNKNGNLAFIAGDYTYSIDNGTANQFDKDTDNDGWWDSSESIFKTDSNNPQVYPWHPCNELWACGAWSSCDPVTGTKSRNCAEYFACGTDANKPAVSAACAP